MSRYLFLFIVIYLSWGPSFFRVSASSRYMRKIDPQVYAYLMTSMYRKPLAHIERSQLAKRAPITIRFYHNPMIEELDALEQAGVHFKRSIKHDDHYLHLGKFYVASVESGALHALDLDANIQRVELDHLPYWEKRPVVNTAREIQAHTLWEPSQSLATGLTGKRVVIGTIDSGIDPYHPSFFKMSGHCYAWMDKDNDGEFKAGVDGVDLNKNQLLDSNEVLKVLMGQRFSYEIWDFENPYRTEFLVKRDWLYVDINGNGERDFGGIAGYDDSNAQTFGEPLYLADDVNRNGVLDIDEKICALGQSKIKKVYSNETIYQRDKNLSLLPVDENAEHGTAASFILLGGQRDFHELVGIAPDAELVLGQNYLKLAPSELLIWLIKDEKVDLVLHEYSRVVQVHLDGSSNTELIIDEASALGVPQIVPAGNLLSATNKNMNVVVKKNQSIEIGLLVPDSVYNHFFLTFLWRLPEADLKFSLKSPDGKEMLLPNDNMKSEWWNDAMSMWFFSWRDDSSRGTSLHHTTFSTNEQAKLTKGRWVIRVENPSDYDIKLIGRLADDLTSWENGIGFEDYLVKEGSLTWPSTADTAITVAAYAGNEGGVYGDYYEESHGDLRSYSGRGKRIDGVSVMDIAAPDHALSALSRMSLYNYPDMLGAYRPFGGTSSAGPHVAGAIALMKEYNANTTVEEIRDALHDGAESDSRYTLDEWGYGRLKIYRSLFDKDPVESQPPTLVLKISEPIYADRELSLELIGADQEDDASVLRYRWDMGYDGEWDSDFSVENKQTITLKVGEELWLRAEVIDTSGKKASIVYRGVAIKGSGGNEPTEEENDSSGGCDFGHHQSSFISIFFLLLVIRWFALRRHRR